MTKKGNTYFGVQPPGHQTIQRVALHMYLSLMNIVGFTLSWIIDKAWKIYHALPPIKEAVIIYGRGMVQIRGQKIQCMDIEGEGNFSTSLYIRGWVKCMGSEGAVDKFWLHMICWFASPPAIHNDRSLILGFASPPPCRTKWPLHKAVKDGRWAIRWSMCQIRADCPQPSCSTQSVGRWHDIHVK